MTYQTEVGLWLDHCLGPAVAADRTERNHRFLEESLELVQACGGTASDAHMLVDYVFSRPVGEIAQEIGGVRVTLAALANAHEIDEEDAARRELDRVWTRVDEIRAKQATKPKGSPLPGRGL